MGETWFCLIAGQSCFSAVIVLVADTGLTDSVYVSSDIVSAIAAN